MEMQNSYFLEVKKKQATNTRGEIREKCTTTFRFIISEIYSIRVINHKDASRAYLHVFRVAQGFVFPRKVNLFPGMSRVPHPGPTFEQLGPELEHASTSFN